MKESINEHDMTKKMMQIMRGGYKPLLKEEEEPNMGETDMEDPNQNQETNSKEGLAKPPREGRAPLIQLDGSYFELDKNDHRFKDLQKVLKDIVSQAKITSIYISDPEGLVINGVALNFGENSGLYFTLARSEPNILVSSENVQGKLNIEVQTNLQRFWDGMLADTTGTSQYLYNERDDKATKEANEQD
jgi:hypothetical protein